MLRESTKVSIPQEYMDNEKAGLCRVCGKPKSQFDKYRRVFCGDKCEREFQKCFISWNSVRDEIIDRDGACVKCGSQKDMEVDHITALVNGGDMWDKDNLRTLCKQCHLNKTKVDLYKKKYVTRTQTNLLEVSSHSSQG